MYDDIFLFKFVKLNKRTLYMGEFPYVLDSQGKRVLTVDFYDIRAGPLSRESLNQNQFHLNICSFIVSRFQRDLFEAIFFIQMDGILQFGIRV